MKQYSFKQKCCIWDGRRSFYPLSNIKFSKSGSGILFLFAVRAFLPYAIFAIIYANNSKNRTVPISHVYSYFGKKRTFLNWFDIDFIQI